MRCGNPYHDERGRFTSPIGAYNASNDKSVKSTAERLTDYWQENYSEVELEQDSSTGAWEQSHEYEGDAFADEYEEKYSEMEQLTKEIYQEYNDKMNERIADMSAEELQEYAKNPDPVRDTVRASMMRTYGDDEFAAIAIESADEDFDTDVDSYKYRRAVIKTRGARNLFALADNEEGSGFHDARKQIEAKGLNGEYHRWKRRKRLEESIRQSYRNEEPINNKPASSYKDEDAYVRAGLRQHRKKQDSILSTIRNSAAEYLAMEDDEYSELERYRAEEQFQAIIKANPMKDDIHTGIRTVSDIKSFDQAIKDDGALTTKDGLNANYSDLAPDFTASDIATARRTKRVTVYSSKPIEVGAFVTPSKMEAESYAGNGYLYSKEVSLEEVAWIDGLQGQYSGLLS